MDVVVKMERRGLIWLVVRGWRGLVWSGYGYGYEDMGNSPGLGRTSTCREGSTQEYTVYFDLFLFVCSSLIDRIDYHRLHHHNHNYYLHHHCNYCHCRCRSDVLHLHLPSVLKWNVKLLHTVKD